MTHSQTRTLRCTFAMVALALGLLPAVSVGGPAGSAPEAQFAGTLLSLAPEGGYERAQLRIAGPAGYALTQLFETGEPVVVDLLAEAEPRRGEASGGDWRALPDGHYTYELVLTLADGREQTSVDVFFAESGSPVDRRAVRGELANVAEELTHARRFAAETEPAGLVQASDVGSEGIQHNDYVDILDNIGDNLTYVRLLNDSFPIWEVQNFQGLLKLEGFGAVGGLTLNPSENVGIGTSAPATRLHLLGGGLRIEDAGGFHSAFQIAGGLGFFPGVSLTPTVFLANDGDVGVGTLAPTATFHVAGSGRIDGDVALGSSRSLKTGFERVDTGEVLAALADLPLAAWRYKYEHDSERHIGPFAEDFQRLFGLGDGETISILDAQGVTLAAIQGLQQDLAAKDAQIEALTARLASIEKRLALPR